MSLSTEWNKVENNMTNSNDIVEEIYNEKELTFYFENQNKWRAKRYPKSSSKGTANPVKSDITNYTPQAMTYRDTSDRSQNWAWGDNYIGYMECYIYCNTSKSFSFQFWTDDAGQIWLNDSSLGTSTSCTYKTVTGYFKKGLNHLEIMWNEGTGGDGAFTNQTWQNLDWVDWVYANYKNK